MPRATLLAALLLAACSRSPAVGLAVESVTDPLAVEATLMRGTRAVGVRVTVLNATPNAIPVTTAELALEGGAVTIPASRLTGSVPDGCATSLAPDERTTCLVVFEVELGVTPTQIVYTHEGFRVTALLRPGDPPDPRRDAGSRDAGFDAGVAEPTNELDLLVMVDNSGSMTEEQWSFSLELPNLLGVLGTGDYDGDGSTTGPDDFEPFDIHFGVITSDMGTGGFTVPTCARADFGDDGILRTQGRTDIAGCMATYPAFLRFLPGVDDPDETARDFACVAVAGTGGCGFEQPLEAILKALSPSAPTPEVAPGYTAPVFFRNTFGHGDTNNDGFLRRDSVLAIVMLTDEEDCSARDPELFNLSSAVYGATDLNLRCLAHAEDAVHPISRYVDGFLQLRRFPSRLVFVPIAGVPVDLARLPLTPTLWDVLISEDPAVRDDRMEERVDPAMPSRLIPSCNVPGRGVAFPPVRIVRVAERLQRLGAEVAIGSICQESFAGPIDAIVRAARGAGR